MTSTVNGWNKNDNSPSTCSIVNQTLFSQWFRDVEGVNIRINMPFTLTKNGNRFEYKNTAFFPINAPGLGFPQRFTVDGQSRNYHFVS